MTSLAYAVTETYENTGRIVFADRPIDARKIGAGEFNDGQLGGLSVRRAPWADRFGTARALPARVCIDEGWHFECSGCGATIDSDWLYERHLPLSGVIGSSIGNVYCCRRC